MVRNGYVTEAQATAVASTPLPLADGRSLPPLGAVSFVPPPPFDWAELSVGALLLGSALAAFVAARLVAPNLALRISLKVVATLLLLAGALTAAYSVQVV